ncbi:MAG: hypothetical protein R3C56_13780 [Pirellulaceae bacterium]
MPQSNPPSNSPSDSESHSQPTRTIVHRRQLLAGGLRFRPPFVRHASGVQTAPTAEQTTKQLTPTKRPVTWPMWDDSDATGLLDVLNSGHWGRLSGKRGRI